MGKKVINQASVKISKDEKQKFNSLIKVLRPKVYITDSSRFKKLVQELTGNGSSTPLSPPSLEQSMVHNCNLIGTEFQREPESSVDFSVSTQATSNSSDSSYAELMNEEFNQVCDQLCLDDFVFQDSVTNQSAIDQLLACQNLESLLFGVEQDPFFYNSCYEQIAQPEISIFDYELSGLL